MIAEVCGGHGQIAACLWISPTQLLDEIISASGVSSSPAAARPSKLIKELRRKKETSPKSYRYYGILYNACRPFIAEVGLHVTVAPSRSATLQGCITWICRRGILRRTAIIPSLGAPAKAFFGFYRGSLLNISREKKSNYKIPARLAGIFSFRCRTTSPRVLGALPAQQHKNFIRQFLIIDHQDKSVYL